jgi:hypothetical protein
MVMPGRYDVRERGRTDADAARGIQVMSEKEGIPSRKGG